MASPFTARTCWVLLGMESLRLFRDSLERSVVHRILISLMSLGRVPGVLALELLLHVIPTIFYWV
jgi:hypothetical protein